MKMLSNITISFFVYFSDYTDIIFNIPFILVLICDKKNPLVGFKIPVFQKQKQTVLNIVNFGSFVKVYVMFQAYIF